MCVPGAQRVAYGATGQGFKQHPMSPSFLLEAIRSRQQHCVGVWSLGRDWFVDERTHARYDRAGWLVGIRTRMGTPALVLASPRINHQYPLHHTHQGQPSPAQPSLLIPCLLGGLAASRSFRLKGERATCGWRLWTCRRDQKTHMAAASW